jgi:hypothetical protein
MLGFRPLLFKRFVSRDTRRQNAARFVGLFYARDIWRSSEKISSGGGQIVSVLPMSFRIVEWKMDPCVIYFVCRRIAEKRRKRRWAVHPIKSARFEDGAFRNPYGKLRDDSDKFFLTILECQQHRLMSWWSNSKERFKLGKIWCRASHLLHRKCWQ